MDNDQEVWAVYLFTYDPGACCGSPELWKTWIFSSKSMAQNACAKIYKAVQHEQNQGRDWISFCTIKYERLSSSINSLSATVPKECSQSEALIWLTNHEESSTESQEGWTEEIDLTTPRDPEFLSPIRKEMADQLRRWRNIEGDWSRKRMAQAFPV